MASIGIKFKYMNLNSSSNTRTFYFNPEYALENVKGVNQILHNNQNGLSGNFTLINGDLENFIKYCTLQESLQFNIIHSPFIIKNTADGPHEILVFLDLTSLDKQYKINMELNFKPDTSKKFCIVNFGLTPELKILEPY